MYNLLYAFGGTGSYLFSIVASLLTACFMVQLQPSYAKIMRLGTACVLSFLTHLLIVKWLLIDVLMLYLEGSLWHILSMVLLPVLVLLAYWRFKQKQLGLI